MRKAINRIFLTAIAAAVTIATRAQLPVPYAPGTKASYIRTWDATAPETNASTLLSRPLKDAKVATQYIDGLGRPLQSVVKQGSLATGSQATDLVSPVIYDEFGRELKKYLPFAANNRDGNNSISDGLLKLNPFQQQETFAQTQYSGELTYYGKTDAESSPLNRTLKTMTPGDSWAGAGRGVEMKYWANTSADNVQMWKCDDVAGSFGNYSSLGAYTAGQLVKTVTVDERGKQVIEFKDKEGKVILKKVQLNGAAADNGAGTGYTNWLCTYYIYDVIGRLRCVIQPEGVKQLALSGWALPPSGGAGGGLLAEQCFRYEYDERSRMTMKKVPGAGEVYMVYDMRDRLVMTQDANMRAQGKWMVTKYDILNRPGETGLWVSGITRADHQLYANLSASYPSTASGYELLSITHYDDYTGLPAGLSDFLTTWNTNFSATSYSTWPYAQMPQKSTATRGMVTWAQTKVLGTAGTFINTVSYYDDKGRVIQVQSTNITGGLDVMTTQYSWAGQPLVTVQRQQKSGTNASDHVVITRMQYDDLGRVLTVKKTVNSTVNGAAVSKPEQLIASNKYDKLGQLKEKQLGAGPGTPLYNAGGLLSYDYNIRGWMLGMNRNYLSTTGQGGTSLFGYELGYDKLTNSGGRNYTAAQYNGNISGMIWKSDGDDVKRKYDFTYDDANRLMKGLFEQDDALNSWNRTTMDYSMQMGNGADPLTAYDANGNIKGMTQYGWKLGASVTTPIDNMRYTYYTGTNWLKSVTDFNNDAQTKLGDFRTAATHQQAAAKTALLTSSPQSSFDAITDYTYDANGNMNLDNNKAISSIVYNHLNLPSVITVTGKGTITYTYDAGGNKLKKTTVDNTIAPAKTTITLYLGGAVYENDVLQFLSHEEGRIRYSPPLGGAGGGSLQYDYMLKDHLGNVRMVLTEEMKTDAYPAASMETAQSTTEEALYANLPATRTPIVSIAGYPNDTYTSPNAYVARVKAAAGSQKIGPSITLKVMAGDKLNIRVSSWYKTNGVVPGTPVSPLNDLLTALAGGIGGLNSTHGGSTAAQITNSGVLASGATNFLSNQTYVNSRPKAFLNWILFDEQFKFVASSSNASQVGADQEFKTHVFSNVPMNKNGYLYVYVSNETPNIDVFFDNLQVTHVRGPILEETHYYPFGLTMSGISSKALNGQPENKKKYQQYEFNSGFDINLYESFYRSHDPQIGRFWQIDPKPTDFESPYAAMGNNPIFKFDALGDTVFNANATDDAAIVAWITQGLNLKKGQVNPFSFNDDGDLQVDKESFNKLSKAQKKIGQNIIDAINSTDLLEVQLVDKDEVIETYTVKDLGPNQELQIRGRSYKNGDVVQETILDYGGGRVKPPEINGNGLGSNRIVAQVIRQENPATAKGIYGTPVQLNNFTVFFHEAFGHFVYHYIQNSCTQNQQTIDYENSIRRLRGMPLRSGTDHPKDKDY